MIYTLVIYDIVVVQLPHFLAKTRQIAWLLSLIKPIETLNNAFQLKVDNIRYRLNLNGQIIYLERYLNDLYDPVLRRIYISDDAPIFAPTVFNKVENALNVEIRNKAEPQPTTYLRNRDEYQSQFDFIVNVPNQINLTTQLINQIKVSVNRYRIAGKRFKVQST